MRTWLQAFKHLYFQAEDMALKILNDNKGGDSLLTFSILSTILGVVFMFFSLFWITKVIWESNQTHS